MVSARGRPHISSPHFAFFIISFISAAHGARHDSNQCHISCHGSGEVNFEDGYRYVYKFEGSSRMHVGGSSQNLATNDLSSTVYITKVTPCTFRLELEGTRLTIANNSESLGGETSTRGGVLAGMDSSGKLFGHVCASPDLSSGHLNVHRAVLSLIQTHVPKHVQPSVNSTLHQTDIFGVCSTDYTVKENGVEINVFSTKDFDSCAHREEARLPLLASPYSRSKSGFERTNGLEGTLTREQKFVNRVLYEVKSNEYYKLAHLSDDSSASVTVTSKLTFLTKAKTTTVKDIENYVEKSMLFETSDNGPESYSFDKVKSSLEKLSDGREPVVQEKNPREFSSFVQQLKAANKQDIIILLNLVKEGKNFKNRVNARKILLDGVCESASSAAVEIMPDLLKSGEISGIQARLWFMSFSNTKNVSKEAVKASQEILKSGFLSVQAYLGIGALVGKFCVHNDCTNLDIINSIEETMAKSLFESCKPTDIITENNLVASLKGLGNIRILTDRVARRLSECALDKTSWMRVRVAALETMKTDAKNPIVVQTAEKILKDFDEDSELRIKAYLSLVENPSSQVADIVKEVIINEKSNQVGGFIASHLRNVKSSTSPDKVAARYHLGGIYSRSEKFGWDPKKYSQNYELSYNGDSWGVAAESNVIYSQRSYLPRSLGFNLTTLLYGHSFNLFEIGVRTENIEKTFEQILRSLTMKRENINELLRNGTDIVDDFANKLSHTLRPKRSIGVDKLNDFYNKVPKQPKVYHDELLLDLSIKSLGAETEFFSHLGNDIGARKSLDQMLSGLEYTMDKAKHLNIEYSKHTTFLEGEIIYPTGLGLPLRLKTRGSAAFGLAAEAKIDIPSALQSTPVVHHMKLKLVPSGSVEVIGSLTMDSGNTESGVEVTLSAHSSTGGDVRLKFIKGKEIEVVLGVPLREQTLFSISTGLNAVSQHNNDINTIPVDLDISKVSIEDYSGCFEQLSTITGLTFCGELSMPNNNVPTLNPFFGPSKLALSFHVEDESIKYYILKLSYDHNEEKKRKKFNLLLDTPGSKINRKVSMGYESEVSPQLKQVKVHMESFWKSMLFQGAMMETEKEISITGKLKYDDNEYSSKAGLTMTKSSPSITVYTPFFHYSIPHHQSRLVGRNKSSYPALKLTGEVLLEKKESESMTTILFNHLTVETHRSNFTIDGSISFQCKGESSTIDSDMKIIYDEEFITINGTISRPDLTRIEGNLAVFPSINPFLAFSAQGRLENVINQDFKFLAEFDFTHGPDPNNKDLRFSFNNHVLISGIRENNVKYIAIRHYVGYPPTNLLVESDLEWLPRNLKYGLVAKLDQSSADFKFTASTDPAGPYDVFLAAMFMDQGFKLQAKRELIDSHKSKFTNSFDMTPGKLFQVNALVNHKFIWTDLDFAIQSEIKTPLQPKHIRLSTALQNNGEKILGQLFFEADSKVYVDFFTERIKGPESKGNFKLVLTDYIDGKGDFGFQDSVLKGSGYLILVKSQHKMNGAVDMIIKYPKYAGVVELAWNPSTGEKKSLKLDTETLFENEIFDTKNKLMYEGTENQFNMRTKQTGNRSKGTTNVDVEIKLGEGSHVVGKYSRNVNAMPGDAEGEYNLELSHRPSSKANQAKLAIKLIGKHVDFNLGKIDGQLAITYVSPEDRDLIVQLAHKKMPKDDKWLVNCLFDVSGSLMDNPMNLKVESEVSRNIFADSVSWSRILPPSSYRISASVGKDTNVESYGKMTGNTFSGEITVRLPQAYKLTSFKWTTINLVQLHPGPDNKRQVKASNVFKWNEKFFEIDSELVLESGGGSIKFDWETEKTKKRSVYLTSHWPLHFDAAMDFDISVKYDKDGKQSDAFVKYTCNQVRGEGSFHFHGVCPSNGVYDLKIASKKFNEGKGVHTEWVLVVNNKTRKGLYKILPLQDHPYIEFYMEDEDLAKSGFLIKADKTGMAEWAGNVHVEWAVAPGKKGFFHVNSKIKLKSLDDFLIKVEANSNKYQLKDWQLEIYSLGAGSQTVNSKNVAFRMLHDSKTLLNGTASYDLNYVKEGIYRIEAKGEAMFDNSLEPISMKAMWKPSAERKGFNGSLVHGENKISVESVFDDSQIYYVRKYCSPSLDRKCSEARIIWNSVTTESNEEEKNLQVLLDLSSMNPVYNDLILKANLKKGRGTMDQKVEFQWVDNRMFMYKAYFYQDKAGVTIGLPQRTMSGDVLFQFPTDINQGRLFIESNVWLNKLKDPSKKTYLLLTGEIARDKQLYSLNTEAKLSHPSLSKGISMKGKATVGNNWSKPKSDGHFEFDIFKHVEDTCILAWDLGTNDEKCTYSSHNFINIKSKGMKIDMAYDRRVTLSKTSFSSIVSAYYVDQNGTKKEALLKAEAKPKKFRLSFKLPEVSMYDVSYTMEKKNKTVILLGNYQLAATEYQETIEINNEDNLNYQFQFGKGKALYVDAGFAFGQMAEFKASINKNPIYDLEIALSEADFLKVKHNYNKGNFRKLIEIIGEEISIIANSFDKEIKRAVDRDGMELGLLVSRIGNSLADPSPLLESYQQDMEQLAQEILEDEALKQVLTSLRDILSSAVETSVTVIEELLQLTAEIRSAVEQATEYAESIISSVAAKIKETSNSVYITLTGIIESCVDAYLNFTDSIFNEFNKHHKEVQAIATVVSEFSQDMGRMIVKFGKQIKNEFDDFIRVSWEELKMMPLFQLMEEKFKELKNYKFSEGYWPDIQEILRMVADAAPNPELKRFITTLTQYIDQYIKEETMDLDSALKQIFSELLESIKPTIDSIYDAIFHEDIVFNSKFWVPMPWVSLWSAGKSSGGVRLNLISWILSDDHLSIIDYCLHLWNSMCSFLPPYKAKAYIIGSEMVTYDGKEVSLKDGSYILAQQLENKFSIVAQVKDGAMVSIQLIQGSDFVEYTPDGKLWLNNKDLEYNFKSKDGKPGVRYTISGGNLESDDITVICQWGLSVCRLDLKSSTFAKVRGVLGTYNYESYDEFTLPGGKVASNEDEFLNSWKLDGSIPLVRNHSHKHQPKCTQLFTSTNQLMFCNRLVNPKPFREMCDHAVEKANTPEEKKKALCHSAYHYTRECRANNLKVDIPPPCNFCQVEGQEVTVDEVKVMKKQTSKADIVFLVELRTENSKLYKSLLRPLAQQLGQKLNSMGVSDVEYGLIGFGSKDLKFINYFKKEGKLQMKKSILSDLPWDKLPSKRLGESKLNANATFMDKLWNAIDQLYIADDKTERGIVRAGISKAYPWRAGSYRSIISLVSSPCPLPEPFLSPLTRIKMAQRLMTMNSYGIVYNLITPVRKLTLRSGKASDVIGFTKDEAYVVNDIGSGTSSKERKKIMSYSSDACHLFPLETGGNVFIYNNIMNEDVVDAIASRVGTSLLAQEKEYLCRCIMNHGLHPKYECIVQS